MKNSLRKFKTTEEFDTFRSTDGWEYPNVCYVGSSTNQVLRYNNEFIVRWYDEEDSKVPYFLGDVTYPRFKEWVNSASMPCEIKKDGTEFNYLLLSDFNKTATDHTGLVEKGLSHYNTPDKSDYLQLTEIKNINVGLFENPKEKYKEIHFNFNKGCPERFHKWFSHPYWNKDLGCYTKLFGRYDSTPVTNVNFSSTEGLNCCFGDSQGTLDIDNKSYSKGNFDPNILMEGNNFTINKEGYKVLEVTYWEHLVLSYIYSTYYDSFDSNNIFSGIQTKLEPNFAGSWINGQTDTLKTPHGSIKIGSNNEPYRFMYMENPLYGKQNLWTPGLLVDSIESKYWMTFDDIIANKYLLLIKELSNVSGSITLNSGSWKYISNINLFGLPIEINGSSNSGFYDTVYSKIDNNLISYVGDKSWEGNMSGTFSRIFDVSNQSWNIRGRMSVNR